MVLEGRSGRRRILASLILACSSLFFFADACLRASQKYFWFDELCSLAIVQLPTFSDSWQAVLHGADFNPPLFYVIMRATHQALGDGLIAQRIPAMAGIWTFCVSLGVVAWRRGGGLPGITALLFPLATIAGYYAAEARPHAIVLGFTGLAIVCWHRINESERPPWLAAFALALLAALLTHCYALLSVFPFAAFECVLVLRKQVRWRVWLAVVAPVLVAGVTYLPLLSAYRANLAGTGFAYQFRAGFWQLPYFYSTLLAPAILVLIAALLAVAHASDARQPANPANVLAMAFVLMPIAAILFCMVVAGPFISRYFLAAIAGFSLLLAHLVHTRTGWARYVIPAVLIFTLLRNSATLVAHRWHGQAETLMEPVVDIPVNTTVGQPLARYKPLLVETGSDLPIVVAKPMDFLYLVHYAPQLRARLYYIANSTDEPNYRLYRNVREWCHLPYNAPATFGSFLPQHHSFYLWGDPPHLDTVAQLSKQGAHIEQWDSNAELYLAKLRMIR